MSAEPSAAESADSRQPSVALVIGSLATVLLMAALGQTIVSTALPTIVADLGGLDHLSWVITAYLLAATVTAPIYGKLSDLYGRKIVLQSAIVVFLIGSAVCGLAGNMTVLILGRFVQGMGGGALMVLSMTVVADVIPPRHRGRIQGVFGGVFGIATVIGPLLGGFIVEHASWHWVFFVNLPLGILAFSVIALVFRRSGKRVAHRIDYPGAALLASGLSSIVLFTSLGGRTLAWDSIAILGLGALAFVSIAAFIVVERRAAEPVLPLALFANQVFSVSSAVGFIVGLGMFGSITFLPLYLQVVKAVSPTDSGLLLLPMMVGLFGASILCGQWMSWTGRYRILPIIGTAIMALGLWLLSTMTADTEIWRVSVFVFVVGFGIGPVMTVSVTATQNAVRRAELGVATAGTTMFRQIGGSIGVALFGTIFSARLADELAAALPVGTMTPGATGSIGPAVVQALPAPLRGLVLAAFTNALHPVFLVAAAGAVLAFLLSFLLPEIPLSATLREEPESELAAEEEAAAAVVGGPVVAERGGRV